MNGLGKPFGKQIRIKKLKKYSKIKVKLPHMKKRSKARKQIFIQTAFSHSTLKF